MALFRRILKWTGITLLVVFIGLAVWIGPRTYDALYPSRVHETVAPNMPERFEHPAVLVFSKTNGFRHGEAIEAGNPMFVELGKQNSWSVFVTENGAVHSPELLARFKAVVWNNASGDNLSAGQRDALKAYVENGGGFIAVHAAGDGSHGDWPWYAQEVIGAKFVGHTLWPHVPEATVLIEAPAHPAMAGLPSRWSRADEWYSFDRSVRAKGFQVLATVDEASYERGGPGSAKLAMGKDHPVIWSRCLGKGRVLYSALGHTGESFAEPEMRRLMTNALGWAMSGEPCEPEKPQ